jgi:hypothetical protein
MVYRLPVELERMESEPSDARTETRPATQGLESLLALLGCGGLEGPVVLSRVREKKPEAPVGGAGGGES